ncbi:MAG: hypothetical protein ACOVLG_12370 [Flavobacterium sp.]
MKKTILILILLFSIKSISQQKNEIRLSEIKLCELTLDNLKQNDIDLKQITLEEMDLCSDGFVQDGRFENRIGYSSKLYPGVIFQKYDSNSNLIAKIHLTKDFKGFLPDGKYVDLKNIKAGEIIAKYDSLDVWTSRGCSDYLGINKNKELYFYVKLNKSKEPRYPINDKYYSEQQIEGIDIITDCYTTQKNTSESKPLYLVDGKEVTEKIIAEIKPDDVESINVLKDLSATKKYGEKGKNGVIEIFLKKK